jgi:hypothetical protein
LRALGRTKLLVKALLAVPIDRFNADAAAKFRAFLLSQMIDIVSKLINKGCRDLHRHDAISFDLLPVGDC